MTGDTQHLNRDFRSELIAMERDSGFPWHVTSGKRSPGKNKKVGGVRGSAHVIEPDGKNTGVKAADIATVQSWKRYVVVALAYRYGYRRIGIGKTFVHLDRDLKKPQMVMWHYYPAKKRRPK